MAASEMVYFVANGTPVGDGIDSYLTTGAILGLVAGIVVGAYRQNRWEVVPLGSVSDIEAAPPAEVAPPPDFSTVRSWVRVRTTDGRRYEGAVRSASVQALTMQLTDGELVTVPLASLKTVELHQGLRRQPLRSMAEGVLGGAAVGAVVGWGIDRFIEVECFFGTCPRSRIPRYARRGAIEGLIAGTIVGLFREVDRWEGVPLAQAPHIIVAPASDGGLVLGVSIPEPFVRRPR
jgi:hypothetical protein